jgi:hypothetical protein
VPNVAATRSDAPSTNSKTDRQPIEQLGLLSPTRPSLAHPVEIKAGVAAATSSTNSKTVAGPVLSNAGGAAATSSAAGCSAQHHVHEPQTHHIGKLEGELSQPDTSGKPYTQQPVIRVSHHRSHNQL